LNQTKDFFGPKLTPDFERIVETTFAIDIGTTYKRIDKSLVLGEENRSSYGAVNEALDKAETNARDAFRLYLVAKIELQRFEAEADTTRSGMWASATAALQAEKAEGVRTKAITNDDIRFKCIDLFPDEWHALEERHVKVKAAVAAMEKLSELATVRIRTLQVILSNLRK
jgi:hypothetical protein